MQGQEIDTCWAHSLSASTEARRFLSLWNADAVTLKRDTRLRELWSERGPALDRWHWFAMKARFHWDDAAQFDLVLDTGALTLETATEQLVTAAQAVAAKPLAAGAPTTAKFKVDSVLADAVAKVLANPLPALATDPT